MNLDECKNLNKYTLKWKPWLRPCYTQYSNLTKCRRNERKKRMEMRKTKRNETSPPERLLNIFMHFDGTKHAIITTINKSKTVSDLKSQTKTTECVYQLIKPTLQKIAVNDSDQLESFLNLPEYDPKNFDKKIWNKLHFEVSCNKTILDHIKW